MNTSRIQFSPLNILRFTAIAGTFLALVYEIFSVKTLKLNQHYSFYALIIVALSVGVSLMVLRKTFLTVLQNYDLLVPIGIYITLDFLTGFVGQSSTFVGYQNGRLNLAGLSFPIVVGTILKIAIVVLFTGWMTRVILRFVQTDKVELFHSFANIKWWFPRTLIVILFGWIPIYILLFFFIPVLFRTGSGGKDLLYLFIIFIGISSVIWNILTSAVLPNVLWSTINPVQAIIEGISLSWKNKTKTFLPIILLMFVGGWITYISVTYELPETEIRFGEAPSYTSSLKRNFNLTTNFVWVGDYPESSNWHKNMMKTVEEQPLSSVDFRIKILILFLSLIVTLHIVKTIFGNGNADIGEFPRLDKFIISNNQMVIPTLAAIAVLFPFELINPAKMFRAKESEIAKFSELKVFSGEDFFSKKEFFVYKQNDQSQVGVPQVDNILNLTVLGDKSDVVISGSKNALVLDKNGNFKEEIKFNLGRQKGSPGNDSYFKHIEVLDIDNDGRYEFAGIADYPYNGLLLNHLGNIVWRFDDVKDNISLKKVSVKDVDGDKEKEIIVQDEGIIKFFMLNGVEKWSQKSSAQFLSGDSTLFDIDGDGKDEIITDGYSGLTIGKLKDDSLQAIKIPYTQHSYLTDGVAKPLIVFFDRNNLGLFDFKGNLVEKYSAPLSYIEKENFVRKDDDFSSPNFVSPYKAQAFKVKLKQDKPEYLAVSLTLATETTSAMVDMLYVYDENGELVYQESTGGHDHLIQKLPLENGTEGLLIQKGDSIRLYKAN